MMPWRHGSPRLPLRQFKARSALFELKSHPLYFVTDERLTGGRSNLQLIAEALDAGITLIQYRDKSADPESFEADAGQALALCRKQGALLIVDDRVEIARRIGADGVHLGQEDMPPAQARELLGPDTLIGLSTHNREEVLAAASEPVDYINIGPMFPTRTKEHARYPALGPDQVFQLAELTRFPFTTMGGIKTEHLRGLFARGAQTVAMVTEISLAVDVKTVVRDLLAEISAGKADARVKP